TKLTPEDDDKLTEYLWPIVREMIKTAIENKQNLIVEGCYIPFDWKNHFTREYLDNIKYYCLVMSENYIKNYFDNIKKYANAVENRLDDEWCTIESVLEDNAQFLELVKKYNVESVLIDDKYDIDMDFQLDYQNHKPLFITLAGLPGTGKTTLAKALAKNLSLVYLRLDCIEAPFYRYNATSGSKGEGYDAIVNLARENLNLGLGVIVDTVNPLHLTRKLFRDLAKESNANLLQFELKTNNLLLHKKRIEQRKADIVGHNLPTWDKVLNVEYEEWDESVDGLVTVIFTDNGETAFSECLGTIRNHLD
ncbi:MAG: AAA family ATPase, partial [Muribaculaceae bacterium]